MPGISLYFSDDPKHFHRGEDRLWLSAGKVAGSVLVMSLKAVAQSRP
jgi:hypothetical protein